MVFGNNHLLTLRAFACHTIPLTRLFCSRICRKGSGRQIRPGSRQLRRWSGFALGVRPKSVTVCPALLSKPAHTPYAKNDSLFYPLSLLQN